jgi:hypothetical protein
MRKLALALVMSLALVGCTTAPRSNGGNKSSSTSSVSSGSQPDKTLTEDGVTATLYYQHNGTWMFDVDTELPTPCYTLEAEALVAESYPEQIQIQATISNPDPSKICTQVITPKQVSGTVNASENATFTLKVTR